MTNTVLFWNELKHICHTEINSVQTKTPFQQHISPTSKQLDMKTKPHLMPLTFRAWTSQREYSVKSIGFLEIPVKAFKNFDLS